MFPRDVDGKAAEGLPVVYRPNKVQSIVGIAAGALFILIGIIEVIPSAGLFGVVRARPPAQPARPGYHFSSIISARFLSYSSRVMRRWS